MLNNSNSLEVFDHTSEAHHRLKTLFKKHLQHHTRLSSSNRKKPPHRPKGNSRNQRNYTPTKRIFYDPIKIIKIRTIINVKIHNFHLEEPNMFGEHT